MKKRVLALLLCAALVGALLPTMALAAAPALDGIAYPVGDRAACKMDAAMARAYIKAIRQAQEEMKGYDPNAYYDIPYDSQYDDLCVALVDLAGDGYPILITAVLEVTKKDDGETGNRTDARENWGVGNSGSLVVLPDQVALWSYENGVAYDAEVPILSWAAGDYGDLNGQTAIHTGWSSLAIEGGGEENWRHQYYGVSQGKITMLHDVSEFGYYEDEERPADVQPTLIGDWGVYTYITDMGKPVSTSEAVEYEDGRATIVWPKGYRSIDYLFSSVPYGYHECCIETTRADQAIAALQKIVDAQTAFARSQRVEVDGAPVIFPSYALKDEAGNETNYVKVRDFAQILNQMTDTKFNVTWNADLGAVDIVRGEAYVPNGSELANPFSGDRAYETPEIVTLVDGEAVELDTFQLKDDNGGGYTYYKLRDLGEALGIKVDWSKERGIFIETK